MIVTARTTKSKYPRKATIDNMEPGEVFSLASFPAPQGDNLYMAINIAMNVDGLRCSKALHAVRIQGNGYITEEIPPTFTAIIDKDNRKEYTVLGKVTEIIYEEEVS